MAALGFEVRQLFRAVRRQPGFFTVAALTLAVGFAAHLSAFTLVDRMLLAPPAGVQQPDRVFRLHIDRETGREVTLGAVYAALERMERKGLLSSAMSASTGERGGRRRRLFAVTDEGLRVLSDVRRAREALWQAVPRAVRSRT